MHDLARFMRARRGELGLGIIEAAHRAGLSDTRWRQIEDGAGGLPRPQSLVRIARALEVDPERIFGLAGRTFERTGERQAQSEDLAARVESVALGQEAIAVRLDAVEENLSQIQAALQRLELLLDGPLSQATGR